MAHQTEAPSFAIFPPLLLWSGCYPIGDRPALLTDRVHRWATGSLGHSQPNDGMNAARQFCHPGQRTAAAPAPLYCGYCVAPMEQRMVGANVCMHHLDNQEPSSSAKAFTLIGRLPGFSVPGSCPAAALCSTLFTRFIHGIMQYRSISGWCWVEVGHLPQQIRPAVLTELSRPGDLQVPPADAQSTPGRPAVQSEFRHSCCLLLESPSPCVLQAG